MERYIHIINDNYYDCVINKFVKSSKRLSSNVPNNLCRFTSIYTDEIIDNNINRTRQQLILSVTEKCNFRCEYCIYYDQKYTNDFHLSNMDFSTAKMAIDDFLANSKFSDKRCISFYGGEPLMNFDLIKKCVEYINSKNILSPIDYLITTNGLKMDKQVSKFLYKNKFFVNISMDGSKDIHDRYRKLVNGDTTFDTIIKNVKYLISLNNVYWENALSFICVLAPPVNINSVANYFELLPYNFRLSGIDITNHMYEILLKQNYLLDNQKQMIYLKNKNRMNQGTNAEIRRIKQIMSTMGANSFIRPGRYCIPSIKRTFVSVAGSYYICEKDDMHENRIIGNAFSGINIDKIKSIRDEIEEFHKQNCSTCWAVRFCSMCFAVIDDYPKICDRIKSDTINTMKIILETMK